MNTWGNQPGSGPDLAGSSVPPGPPAWTPQVGGFAAPPNAAVPPGPVGYGWYAPPKPTSSNSGPVVGLVVLVFVGMVGIATMVGLGGTFATISNASSLPDLKVGQCFNGARPDPLSSGMKIVDSVNVVACSEPHDSELVASFQYPASPTATFPGDDEVSDYADSECSSWFFGYVGIASGDTDYGLTYFVPLEANWAADD